MTQLKGLGWLWIARCVALDLCRLPLEIKEKTAYISSLCLKSSCNHQAAASLQSSEGNSASVWQTATHVTSAQKRLRSPNNLVYLSRRSENLIMMHISRPTGNSTGKGKLIEPSPIPNIMSSNSLQVVWLLRRLFKVHV